jgi:Family of unknown function (DUF6675)
MKKGSAPRASRRRQVTLCVVLLALLLSWPSVARTEGIRPPCGTSPWPPFAAVATPPAVEVWTQDDTGSQWEPPACTGWDAGRFNLAVAVSGRFREPGGIETILSRFGAVSRWTGVRYWSVSRKRWQGLVEDAHALDGPDGKRRRGDFAPEEMRPGRDLYFSQTNSGSGSVVYRLRVRERSADRLVLETENVTAVRVLAMPIFSPGDLRTLYFFERSPPDAWSYYSLAGVDRGSNPVAQGREASYVNRAVAIFRHVAGLPTDQEPPAAP